MTALSAPTAAPCPVGELASTCVHGANRPASHSRAGALPAARRRARLHASEAPADADLAEPPGGAEAIGPASSPSLRTMTSRSVGVLRDGEGLRRPGAALAGTESRGTHRRSDTPVTSPEWEVRLVHRLDDARRLHTRTRCVRVPISLRGVA